MVAAVSCKNEENVREEIEKQSLSYIYIIQNSDSSSEGQMCYKCPAASTELSYTWPLLKND